MFSREQTRKGHEKEKNIYPQMNTDEHRFFNRIDRIFRIIF